MTSDSGERRRRRRFAASSLALVISALALSCPLDPWDEPIESAVRGVTIVDAFPAWRFRRPVFATWAPGDRDGLYVVEQHGEIHRLDRSDPSAPPSRYLDVSERVSRRANETGLLGLAFHPAYAVNGRVFLHYSREGAREGVVSEFRAKDGRADPDSEIVLLRQPQPFLNHNGGMIAFGPDGFLYVSFGDGGSQGDPQGNGQRLDTWLGKILRIDVDVPGKTRPWSVPRDNPLVGEAGLRPQIWAWGLRNAWRFSFDRATGRMWAGDVGQDRFEEIDVIERGGNYGWNVFEGFEAHAPGRPRGRGTMIPPVAAYGVGEGRSVTGGYVYRGDALPNLRGAYLFGDFVSGRIWTLTAAVAGWRREMLAETHRPIASFGEDEDGEIYLCAFDGRIYKLVPGTITPRRPLADLDLTAGYAEPIPYEPVVSFWSDGLAKRRSIHIPTGETVNEGEDGEWEFPVGTVFRKEFLAPPDANGPAAALETRYIVRTRSGWEAASFADGVLVEDGLDRPVRGRPDWRVPSVAECWTCHSPENGFLLGLESPQRRPDLVRKLEDGGALRGTRTAAALLPRLDDESVAVAPRARAWLHVNCASCHRPGGHGNAAIDLRFETPLERTGLVNVEAGQGDLGIADARLLVPGAPDRSILFRRMNTRGAGAMPPLGSAVIDEEGSRLVRTWIEALGS